MPRVCVFRIRYYDTKLSNTFFLFFLLNTNIIITFANQSKFQNFKTSSMKPNNSKSRLSQNVGVNFKIPSSVP